MSKPTVLFVCVKNAGKSQMAAALLRHVADDAIEVHSAGTHPGSKVNAESAASLAGIGASMAEEYPKAVDPELLARADRVILIGGEAELAPVPGMRAQIERWETDEPSLRGIEGDERMALIRDDLLVRVRQLIADLQG